MRTKQRIGFSILAIFFFGIAIQAGAVKVDAGVNLPEDVKQTIAGYDSALEGDDVDAVMVFYAKDFQADDRDYEGTREWISGFLGMMKDHETTVHALEPIDDSTVRIRASAEHSFGSTEYVRVMKKVDGQWKWFGK